MKIAARSVSTIVASQKAETTESTVTNGERDTDRHQADNLLTFDGSCDARP